MAFDIEMIQGLYDQLPAKVQAARKLLNRPLTLTEKNSLCSPCGELTCQTI
jgi:aconitate hydratase